jgi:hypothetical protein
MIHKRIAERIYRTSIIASAAFALLFMAAFTFNFNPNPTGHVIDDAPLDYYLDNPEIAADSYNENIQHVPGFIKTIFGNERINAELKLDNGSVSRFGIITIKGKILSIQKEGIENASLLVFTNETVISGFISSEDQISYLRNALDTKAIDYKAVRTKTKIKTATGKFLLMVYSWFKR